jgi:hypothetical protein
MLPCEKDLRLFTHSKDIVLGYPQPTRDVSKNSRSCSRTDRNHQLFAQVGEPVMLMVYSLPSEFVVLHVHDTQSITCATLDKLSILVVPRQRYLAGLLRSHSTLLGLIPLSLIQSPSA